MFVTKVTQRNEEKNYLYMAKAEWKGNYTYFWSLF